MKTSSRKEPPVQMREVDRLISRAEHNTATRTASVNKSANILDELGQERADKMLLTMLIIRAFEEKAEELYSLGKVHGTMHLSIGQEAVAVGASSAMHPDDYLLNHHRGHGHCLAWGSDVNLMMAEFLGKENGYCRGRGGSMHIANIEANNLGANGIVAGGIPISVGVGLSIKLRRTSQVVLVIFGDGAANEGAFHESLNLASVWKLPIVFLCENNQYAMSMSVKKAFNIEQISARSGAYNIPGITVDGNDLPAIFSAVRQAAENARLNSGPSLVEAITYRWRGHSKSDRQAYRTREEIKAWQAQDPILRFASLLGKSKEDLERLRGQALETIEQAVSFAESSPDPDPSKILEGVYA